MTLRITIDAFSGRPNPSVVVTGPLAREALARSRPAAPVADAGKRPPVLGYRGVVFEQYDDTWIPLFEPAHA